MSEQDGRQATAIQRPTTNDPGAWKAYWEAQGQEWRTEPEISIERQKYLAERRSITPDIKQGIYPFKDIKLNRADAEWLLATHESKGIRGPVDGSQRGLAARIGLDLRGADLQFVDLTRLPLAKTQGGLSGEEWVRATEEQREMATVHLEGTNLRAAHLEGCSLSYAHLEGARLHEAHLEGADLYRSHLEGKLLSQTDQGWTQMVKGNSYTKLPTTDIAEAFFDAETKLDRITMCDEKHVGIRLGGAHWGGVDVTAVEWKSIKMLRDEYEARQLRYQNGKAKPKGRRLLEYQRATQANRQLAAVLQSQGLNEEADLFAYRGQLLQRTVWRLQRRPLKLLLSWFLYLLAGYGYRPLRSLIAYLIIIFCFMGLYLLNAHFDTPPLRWDEALVLSISSFHGRGFFTQNMTLGDTYARLAAIEAIVGLFIEISFIASLTQRFFGK